MVLMLLSIMPLSAFQKPKPEPAKKIVLTDEEKEIIRNREILENLDLLQNFEKLRFLDLFAEEAGPDESNAAKAATKRDGKKEK
jgi:hypothetical protein